MKRYHILFLIVCLCIVLLYLIYIPYDFKNDTEDRLDSTMTYQSYEDIPHTLIHMLVTIEDKRFWQHRGADIHALLRAGWNNIQGKSLQGWSTIHQQVIKIDQWSYHRSYRNKIEELFGALRLSIHMPREDIILQYVNTIPWKNNIIWRKQACHTYRQKSCDLLTTSEFLVLLSASQRGYNLFKAVWQKASLARAVVLCTTYADACKGIDDFVFENMQYTIPVIDPRVREALLSYGDDAYDQTLAWRIDTILAHTTVQRQSYNANDCCIIVLDDTWALVSMNMCSAWDDEYGKTNACFLPRQTWSAIKPFLYTYAMNKLWRTSQDTIVDDYISYDLGWWALYEPKNFDLRYHGEVSLAYALGNSLNIAAVKLLERVGVPWFYRFLQEIKQKYVPWGSDDDASPDHYGLSLALWTYEISPYDFTRMRQFFLVDNTLWPYARQQKGVRTILSDPKNKVVWFWQDNYISQPWRAIKTGTSRKFIDGWICGVQITSSRPYTVCIRIGNIDNHAMRGSSVEVAGYIWDRIVNVLQ